MVEPHPSYRREFFKSKHHAWLGLTTLGLGFVFGADKPLYLLVGAAAYLLGWIYLPDMPLFRRTVDRRLEAAQQAEAARHLVEFQRKRDALLASLAPRFRTRYQELAEVCQQIEQALAERASAPDGSADPRLHKLDELMWTFLRLLGLEANLERFLELERREDLPGRLREAQAEIDALTQQIESLKRQESRLGRESAEKLRDSRLEGLDVLNKRQARVEQAQANRALVRSELDRLDSQIKLLRADALAMKNPASISARIDATAEHLDHANKWLAEVSQYEDLVGNLPATEKRVGYQANAILPQRPAVRSQSPRENEAGPPQKD